MTAAVVVNANPRGGATNTLLTERTKRRKNTRNINHTNTTETAAHLKHTSIDTHTAAIRQTAKRKRVANDRMTDFPADFII